MRELQSGGRSISAVDIPPKPARYSEPEEPLPREIVERLKRIGVSRLYAHQARSFDLVRRGRNAIIATGTASGKTLCYNLPVLEALMTDRKAKALYLFPTKALARDQMRALARLEFPPVAVVDGDAPSDLRALARREASVVLSNPDMLHCGILPDHKRWANFLHNLKFVVVDEVHALRGAFGSDAAYVFRRLRRLCRYYGSDPVFIMASATIANPKEHGAALAGVDVEVVSDDGAPRGRKIFILWNPPLLDGARGKRKSSNREASAALALLAGRGLRTLCFSKTRRNAELVLRHSRDLLEGREGVKLAAYRAGYLPEERRKIERALFSGELSGVSATNALELGIDVGSLDAVVINGFPGAVISLWQQAGRAGRRDRDAVAILIAGEDPLDQYYVQHPEYLFGRGFEEAVIDLENLYIVSRHVKSAAYELPLDEGDLEFFGPAFKSIASSLADAGELKVGGKRFFYVGMKPPTAGSIRGTSGEEYAIVETTGEIIGASDSERAPFELYPGAVYLHRGESFVVRELDMSSKVALVERATVDYFTRLKRETSISIDEEILERRLPGAVANFGRVSVESHILGFQKVAASSGRPIGFEELDMPPVRFSTEAFWMAIAGAADLGPSPQELAGGLHALEHAMIALLPAFGMCDRWDIGGVSTILHVELEAPAVFVYDGYAGGIGIALRGYLVIEDLLRAVHSHLRSCPCESGCPSCVQSPKCGNLNEPLDKAMAISIARSVISEPPLSSETKLASGPERENKNPRSRGFTSG